MVLRVGADGRVVEVEAWGACELPPDAIRCMKGVAGGLRFERPPEGYDPVIIPAYYGIPSAARRAPSPNAAYTAAAFATVERTRPQLHACEKAAHGLTGDPMAQATFAITVRPVNDAPTLDDQVLAVAEEGNLSGSLLATVRDVDSQQLSAELLAGPQHGSLEVHADGSFSYTPDTD